MTSKASTASQQEEEKGSMGEPGSDVGKREGEGGDASQDSGDQGMTMIAASTVVDWEGPSTKNNKNKPGATKTTVRLHCDD